VSETRAELKVRQLPMMTPRDVVQASLDGLDRGSRRVVVGFSNRILGWITRRLAPAALARRVAGELYRPRNKI
jgi:short-subunit dehydrogenase